MAKSKTSKGQSDSPLPAQITTTKNKFDPALTSLFATSSGPVKLVPKAVAPTKPTTSVSVSSADEDDDHISSSGGDDSDSDEHQSSNSASESEVDQISGSKSDVEAEGRERPRKRRRVANAAAEDLEQSYFRRLGREEEKEQRRRRADRAGLQDSPGGADHTADDQYHPTSASDSDEDSVDGKALDIPQHESLRTVTNDPDKINRTVFLGNVSTEAIKSKHAKRTLARHLRSVLKTPAQGKRPGKLESLRFRSTAYVSGSGPKKATFAKKELMDTTTKSTNAYAVFTTDTAANVVTEKLNGSVVLDRHLRVDSLGHPSIIDHRRCVFVGNLSFVDEETPGENTKDNSQPKRPKGKDPADPEEGLWRTFSKVGKVESVRVVRDQETRVSKGIAYVQFADENAVEAALLLNEKRFPPMLPRKLRIMRAKKMKQKAPSTGLGAKALAKAAFGSGQKRKRPGQSQRATTKGLVFEGHRASSSNTTKGRSAGSKKRQSKRPDTRSSRRGAAFRAAGGKKTQPKRI
ncbi:uncharacterized protein A1O9_04320 [Exophiala aquamarina CBS 119918]|uniref:Nucleolar protein 12 n=1 Tax=Exophiala aquamarina CBS 119918 TaxID=1182545 RepID=A0A072PHX0_9EURO|nr:uncharacterized protein A1O9_04320 [Exophiala aquamarina CBS 119918]KEF59476.1 hypothetical protein A1O9_04320 [Exophiala aquamarina CBS 119918]